MVRACAWFLFAAAVDAAPGYLAQRLAEHGLAMAEFARTGRGVRTERDRAAGERVFYWFDKEVVYAERALERLANSPLFDGLPVTIVMAEADGEAQREMLTRAEAGFASDHPVTVVMERDKAEKVIPGVVAATEHSLLLMGAYGHSPIRRMIVGSTTTEMVRTVKAPVLMVR